MAKHQSNRGFNPIRALQKFVVSGFVVFTFIIYALHERAVSSDSPAVSANAPVPTVPATEPLPEVPQSVPTSPAPLGQAAQSVPQPTPTRPAAPRPTATPVPAAPARASNGLKDGTYTGPEVNAFWGLVRVQASISNGKVTNVQVLEYPSDRRTSQRINQQAIPWLQSEVMQAQSANVDIISGATLTSQAFIRSLQAALSSAKS